MIFHGADVNVMQNFVFGNTFEILVSISGARPCLSVCSTANKPHKNAEGHQRRCVIGVENIARDLVRGRTKNQDAKGSQKSAEGSLRRFQVGVAMSTC